MLRVCYCIVLLLFSSASFAQTEQSSAEISAVQAALNERGFEHGPIDGVYGTQLAKAIRAFAQASGLPVVGKLNLNIQQRLNVVLPETIARYRTAAEKGRASSQNILGGMHANDQGVEKDDAEAIAWYRKAAKQGHASAQNILGKIYANGRGVKKDDTQAVAWYRKAAEQGHASAQRNLNAMYESGRGFEKDPDKAADRNLRPHNNEQPQL